MTPALISQEPRASAVWAAAWTTGEAPSVARPGARPVSQAPATAPAPRTRVTAAMAATRTGAASVSPARAMVPAIRSVRPSSGRSRGSYRPGTSAATWRRTTRIRTAARTATTATTTRRAGRTDACQDSRTGGPGIGASACPGVASPSIQSANRSATPPDSTPPTAQASRATAGPPIPLRALRAAPTAARWRNQEATASARTTTLWKTAMAPKAAAPGSGPELWAPGRAQAVCTVTTASTPRETYGSARTIRRSDRSSGAASLRAVRHTITTVAAASRTSAAVNICPLTARRLPSAALRSSFAVAIRRAAAMVSTPAVVCAARSRATSRRPYQKPCRLSTVRWSTGVSREVPGSRGGGEADS